MYLKKTPSFFQKLFPQFVWRIQTNEPKIFLTFDDGPSPAVTDWILDELKKYNAKASFFCLGKQIDQHPKLFARTITEGHTIGNHTYTHPSGWENSKIAYLKEVLKGAQTSNSTLFRPPFGRLKPSQAPAILAKYQVIMWDVMSGDFDPTMTADEILETLYAKVVPGSIVVFHDNQKSFDTLKQVLPIALDYFSNQGYTFEAISKDDLKGHKRWRKTA